MGCEAVGRYNREGWARVEVAAAGLEAFFQMQQLEGVGVQA